MHTGASTPLKSKSIGHRRSNPAAPLLFFLLRAVLDKNGRAAMNSSGSEPATNRPTTAYPTECIGTYPDTRAAVQGPPANPRRRLASRELPRGGLRPATCDAQVLHLSPPRRSRRTRTSPNGARRSQHRHRRSWIASAPAGSWVQGVGPEYPTPSRSTRH